jgi:hypothetical protein
MNRTLHTLLVVMMLCACLTAHGAKRAVFFEHFSQELCLTCPATADAIDQFRSDFGYEDVVIISYWVQGSQAIPEGNNRGLLFLDEVITPSVIVDGVINIPNPPQDYTSLVDSYNARRNEPSPCLMSVIQNNGNQYTIKIDAEQAFSGYLVVVAYSYFTHDGHNYPCFAREFLTPYTGEAISAGAGDTLLIEKTVSYSGHDGVVAWIHDEGKMIGGGRRFTPWAVLQSADSHAGGTMPTPTPEITATPTQGTPTPTTPPGTPTATPEIPCDELGVTLSMPDTFFHGGDLFFLDAYVCNDRDTQYAVPLFVILDVYGQLFFAPSFSEFDNYDIILPPNDQILQTVLPAFYWPHGAGEAQNIHFHAAMTNQEITDLFGEMDSVTFGWTN